MPLDSPQALTERIAVIGLDHAAGGYLHGLRQPFLEAHLRFQLPPAVDWRPIDDAFRSAAPTVEAPAAAPSGEPLAGALERIVHWTAEFQRIGPDDVFEPGRVLWRAGDGAERTVVALPTIEAGVATTALNAVVRLINRGLDAAAPPPDQAAIRAELDPLIDARIRSAPAPAMFQFLQAAHAQRIPFLRLGEAMAFQLGYGARGRLMQASFTDATSAVGAVLARNKAAAAAIMRQVALPAPAHLAVTDADMAVAAAEKLGYPVVVKPLDLDGGIGVHVGLKDAAAVRKAYADARTHAPTVLVEAFLEGRDFRLVVFQGRLIWAVERIPGGVTGDGTSTVAALVERQNAERRYGGRTTDGLKALYLDEEALALLAESGMDAASVPAAGETIRLRGPANVAGGGVPVPVFDKVHPDNRRLAERAARLFRLDIAGIDLIIPDVGRSWREAGGGICEINGQPSFSTTAYGHAREEIVEGLVQGDGRIPIALMVGAGGSAACRLAERIVAAGGVRVGAAAPDGVWIDGQPVEPGPIGAFDGARLLLGDMAVETAIVAADDARVSRTGLPFDRFDVLAFAGSSLAGAAAGGPEFLNLAHSLLPMGAERVVINAEDAACMALVPAAAGARVILYAARADHAALLDHRAGGGAAVWIERTPDGPRLVLAGAGAAPLGLALRDAAASEAGTSAADVALAAAAAVALGCNEDRLRLGLADVRLG